MGWNWYFLVIVVWGPSCPHYTVGPDVWEKCQSVNAALSQCWCSWRRLHPLHDPFKTSS